MVRFSARVLFSAEGGRKGKLQLPQKTAGNQPPTLHSYSMASLAIKMTVSIIDYNASLN